MKNNRIEFIKLIMVFVTIVILSSCSKDSLTREPQGSIPDPANLSAANAPQFFNNLYTNFIDDYTDETRDQWADNAFDRNPWDGSGAAIQNGSVNSSTEAASYEMYPTFYVEIRNCNVFIKNVDNLTFTDADKISYKAEARVIRAYEYLCLTLYYGDVPLITENNFSDFIVDAPVAKKEDVRAYVLSELKDAMGIIPAQNPAGRLNKYSVEGLYARACYYFGQYTEAETASKDIIDNGPYFLQSTIVDNPQMAADKDFIKSMITDPTVNKDKFVDGVMTYQSIWRYSNNCPEVLIYKEYLPTNTLSSGNEVWDNYCTSYLPANATQGYAINVPIQDLVDAYWSTDGYTIPTHLPNRVNLYLSADSQIKSLMLAANNGLGQNISYQDVLNNPVLRKQVDTTFLQDFMNKDSRFYGTIIYPLCMMSQFKDNYRFQWNKQTNNETYTSYCYIKGTPTPKDIISGSGGYGLIGLGWTVLRLGEIILIYAEAHTQNVGYDGLAQAELNKLRSRCGMPDVPIGLSKTDGLDFIRHERRLELAGEGLRFYDIRLYEDNDRNGGYKGKEAASVMMTGETVDLGGDPLSAKRWAPNLMYLPYPQSAVDKNPQLVAAQTAKGY
jgi:starch-binding outer membrane protein, SusD/RagB family